MKIRFLSVWLAVGALLTISRLAAQDVVVTDPAWLDSETPPAEVLPTFKKRPKPEIPEVLEQAELVAYAIVMQTVDEKGALLSRDMRTTNPHAVKMTEDRVQFTPALRAQKPEVAGCWYAVIFNPRSASPKKENASPRLLAVAPVVVGEKDVPSGLEIPFVLWSLVRVGENGELKNFSFENPSHEILRAQVGRSFSRWRFAPARRAGRPVEAEIRIPVVIDREFVAQRPSSVRPVPLHREQPLYPRAMINSGRRGEVTLEYIVDETGAVKNPIVIRSNNPGFNEAAIEAMMKWKFKPGLKDGKPVSARMQQPFIFSLSDSEGGGGDFSKIRKTSKKKQEKLPAAFQYDVAPVTQNTRLPVYPYAQLRDQISGHATVAFVVDETGKVFQLQVKEASTPEFGLAVAAAVETYEYIPALKAGQPTFAGLRFKQNFDTFTYETIMAANETRLLSIEKNHPEKIYTPKKLDALVKPISQKEPRFPLALMESHEHGEASVEILIDEKGVVRLPRIRSATEPAFGYAAVQAIAEWRFEPPLVGGTPVIARAVVPFVFNNKADDAEPAPAGTGSP